jgi:class 3 adenylate cyclase/predicted ATPase
VDIKQWLEGLSLGRYAQSFAENGIDFDVLPDLTDQDLEEIGVTMLGHRRKLLRAIANLKASEKITPAVAAAPPAPRTADTPERRQVTVLFSDLVGSTALAARMDLEDLRELISAYNKCVAETVRRFGGFVAQYLGDGVLAYFGYPEAHEDDAERAVRAGLELIAGVVALQTPAALQTRVGIATGLVVVGDLTGLGEERERGIIGETPNLAARLQGIAEPNSVVIAEATRRLLGNLFELKDLGARDLRDVGPVGAWVALRASTVESRFEALHPSGLTVLVGREEETELLLRRWSRAKSGEGQVVLISGEAGIGKSRLTAALLESVAPEPHTRLRYFCSPQHTDSAFYPIIGQMERAAGFLYNDTSQQKLDKLDALLAQASTSIQDAALIAEMLSLPNDGRYPALELTPQQRRQKTMEALTAQMETLSRQKPVLMIFEDAQWADPTSLEAFGRVVDRIWTLKVLLLVTFRPEFDAPWVGRPYVTTLTINRLTEREASAMIDRIVGNKQLSANIRQDIIERTDGIPLFVEEMTKAVLEAESETAAERAIAAVPSPTLAVPASLYASLMARLDRLGGSAKELAQIAAAIGREFSHALLASVVPQPEAGLRSALERLIAAGLLFRRGMPPHATYLFKHALVQDAAYGTLLRARREALHACIAEAYERQFHDIVEAQPALLAHHLALAGFAERAIGFWLKAARKAIGDGAVAEAAAQLRQALALVGDLPEKAARQRHEIELQIALGNALMALRGYSAAETDAAFRRARELCMEAADTKQLVRVLWGQFTGDFAGGRERASLAVAEELLRLSERLADAGGRQLGHASVGASLLHLGSFAEARIHFDRALAAGGDNEREWAFHYGQSGRVVAHSYMSPDLLLLGFADQGRRHAEHSIAEAQGLSHPPSLCFAYSIVTRFYYLLGDAQHLAEYAALVARLADEQRLGLWQALGSIYVGWSRAENGAADEAINLIREGLTKYRAVGAGLSVPLYLSSLAAIEARIGHRREAMRLIGEATAVVESGEEGWMSAELHRLAGEIALLEPDPDRAKAQTHFECALAVARDQQAKFWELRAAMSMARLWRDQDKRREASDLLAPVYSWFNEGFATADLKEAKSLLDGLA